MQRESYCQQIRLLKQKLRSNLKLLKLQNVKDSEHCQLLSSDNQMPAQHHKKYIKHILHLMKE